MKPSRLQLRLEEGIRNARSQFEADCLRAERAGYLARVGQFDEVQVELAALHERYDKRPNAEMSAWLNLVEGLLVFSREMGHAAGDKILRANALSRAAGLSDLRALSAAWLAHIDFLNADIEKMIFHLEEALTVASAPQYSVFGRAHLVVAQGYHQGGRLDLALPWYSSARQSAILDGDDSTVSALMHNMAWLRASNLRQAQLHALKSMDEDDYSLLSTTSTENYDLLIGVISLPAHLPILRAKLLTIRGESAEALALFDQYFNTAVGEGLGRLQADLLADRAWCRLQVGQFDGAREDANLAESKIDSQGQYDDRAFAHSRLVEVYSALGEVKSAAIHQNLADIAWHGYFEFQSRMVNSLKHLSIK